MNIWEDPMGSDIIVDGIKELVLKNLDLQIRKAIISYIHQSGVMANNMENEALINAMEILNTDESVDNLSLLSPKEKVSTGSVFNLEQRISEMLREVGVPASLYGYAYLKKAIEVCVSKRNAEHQITKVIYPYVAEQYKTTDSCVERNIRHAIEVAWTRGNALVLEKMFGYSISADKAKPTNSEFIAMLADYIRLEVE